MPDWLLKVVQLLIAFIVMCAATYGKWTDNDALIALWGIAAAFTFTYAYIWLADFFIAKRLGRRLSPEDDEYWS